MKAGIFSPYLDTFGGGEKYIMTIAEILSQNNFDVDIFLDNHLESLGGEYLKKELVKRFNLNLSNSNFIKSPIGKGSSFLERLFFLKKYDVFFYLTDGSIFYPSAKKNILHIQSPIVGEPAKNYWGKLKLKGWNIIIYNSIFTQSNSEKNWPLLSKVIYPPIDVTKIKPLKKKKYILSVGRFFGFLKDKKHEVMIKVFKDLFNKKKIEDWSLNLVGVTSKGDKPYLQELRQLSEGFPINFYPNLEYDELIRLYGEASIYWHAAGFKENDPTKMEHFGISTVEAMSGGVVPIVINKGGQTEIVENKVSGFLWDTLDELKEFTIKLIQDNTLRDAMSKESIRKSKKFSKDGFRDNILEAINI